VCEIDTNLGMKVVVELGHGNEEENAEENEFRMRKVHCGCTMRVHDKRRFCECETWLVLILCGERVKRVLFADTLHFKTAPVSCWLFFACLLVYQS
jgi:hypothetical protein